MASPKTRDSTCPEISSDGIRTGQREALTETFRRCIAACTGKVEGAAFLNKNPHLCNKLPLVKALFPDARFIWISRDLPQVVASVARLFADVWRRQQTWHWWPFPSETTRSRCWNAVFSLDSRPAVSPERIFPGGKIRYIAEYWLESNSAVFDFFNRLPPESHVSHVKVAEEAVLADPVKELADLAAKLEIPCIERDQVRDRVDLSRNEQWHGLLDKPQLEILGDFIHSHAEEIDSIFSGHGHASRYLGKSGVLGAGDRCIVCNPRQRGRICRLKRVSLQDRGKQNETNKTLARCRTADSGGCFCRRVCRQQAGAESR